jgi:hypothetical protein
MAPGARQTEGGGDADEDAGQRQAQPLEHHHALHLADLRSEGEADADLVRPLLDGVGHQAVDADRREEQRGDAVISHMLNRWREIERATTSLIDRTSETGSPVACPA